MINSLFWKKSVVWESKIETVGSVPVNITKEFLELQEDEKNYINKGSHWCQAPLNIVFRTRKRFIDIQKGLMRWMLGDLYRIIQYG